MGHTAPPMMKLYCPYMPTNNGYCGGITDDYEKLYLTAMAGLDEEFPADDKGYTHKNTFRIIDSTDDEKYIFLYDQETALPVIEYNGKAFRRMRVDGEEVYKDITETIEG
jgi:hypothetical protein